MTQHREYRREPADADRSVLFIHGIVGSPVHFREFYQHVPKNWAIRSLLLDGHGGAVARFSGSSMTAWKEQVGQAVDELGAHASPLMIVGHSMGCLLAIDQAIRRPDLVKALFLLAVPLKARMTRKAASQSVRTALGFDPGGDPVLQAAREAYSMDPDRRIWRYLGYLPRYYELTKVMRETRDLVCGLTIPCRVLMSVEDEIVSPRSAEWLSGNASIELDWLEHSDHKYYPPQDKDYLLAEFDSFCRKL